MLEGWDLLNARRGAHGAGAVMSRNARCGGSRAGRLFRNLQPWKILKMLLLQPTRTFKAVVPLTMPGLVEPAVITVEFRHKSRRAFTDWLARMPGRPDADVLDEVIAGWEDGPFDGNGRQVPYSHGALLELLDNYQRAQFDIFRAYCRELTSDSLGTQIIRGKK